MTRGRPRGPWDPTRIAALVLEAKAARLPAARTVARMLNVSLNQSNHMIRATRKLGLLGAGRHYPAPAIVNRGCGYEYRWTCCIHCLVPWPCPMWKSLHTRQNGVGSTDEHANS